MGTRDAVTHGACGVESQSRALSMRQTLGTAPPRAMTDTEGGGVGERAGGREREGEGERARERESEREREREREGDVLISTPTRRSSAVGNYPRLAWNESRTT